MKLVGWKNHFMGKFWPKKTGLRYPKVALMCGVIGSDLFKKYFETSEHLKYLAQNSFSSNLQKQICCFTFSFYFTPDLGVISFLWYFYFSKIIWAGKFPAGIPNPDGVRITHQARIFLPNFWNNLSSWMNKITVVKVVF